MQSIIEVFRMTEIHPKIRADIIDKLGCAINDEHGRNVTEPLVAELIYLLDKNHKIFDERRYAQLLIGIKKREEEIKREKTEEEEAGATIFSEKEDT